jgi:acyl-CoA synthetase (AMP-forming)/AMP-acid ligase II
MRSGKGLCARSLVRRRALTPPGAYALAAAGHPDWVAIIDERGPLTFAEVHRQTDALACALRAAAIDHRDTVAMMCRNHRWFVEASVACCKLGANILYLDPADLATSIADVVLREDPRVLIYDEEFSELLHSVGRKRRHFIAWCNPDRPARCPLLEEMIAREGSFGVEPPSKRTASTVRLARRRLLASRTDPELQHSLMVPDSVMSTTPLRRGEVTVLASPMFGSWGFLHFMLGLRLASTLVLPRTLDPKGVLDAIHRHKATAVALSPDTLRGIMELPKAWSAGYDASALRVIAVEGPALASEVAIPAIGRFGDVLCNPHGSAFVRVEGDRVRQPPVAGEVAPVVAELRLGASGE